MRWLNSGGTLVLVPTTRRETDVKERHLETVLPARGGKVVVVRGAEKGATGKLLAKNKEKETALVQVSKFTRPPLRARAGWRF